MRVLVCGGRHFNDWTFMRNALENLLFHGPTIPFGLIIIDGACPTGADHMANQWALRNGLATERYPVDHTIDGPWPGAGPNRNTRMILESKPDMGICFPGGTGTWNATASLKRYIHPDTGLKIKVVELKK